MAKDAEASRAGGFITPARRAAIDRLAALDAETVSRLMEEIPKLSGGRKRQDAVRKLLFDDLRVKDRSRAVGRVALMVRNTAPDDMPPLCANINVLFSERVKEDPDAALWEYRALVDSGGLESRGAESSTSQISGHFTGELFAARPAEALELYNGLDELGRFMALQNMALAVTAEDRGFVLKESSRMEPRYQAQVYQLLITGEMRRSGLDGAAALLRELNLPPDRARETAIGFISNASTGLTDTNPSALQRLEWLRAQVPAEQFARAGGEFMSRTMNFGVGNIEENRIKVFREYDWGAGRDEAIAGLFSDEWRVSPGKAELKVSLAAEITDPVLRLETLRRLERKFRVNPIPFKAAVETSAVLTPEEKTRIFQQP